MAPLHFDTRTPRGSPTAIAIGLLSLDLFAFGESLLGGAGTRIAAFHRRLADIRGVVEELLGGGEFIVVGSNRRGERRRLFRGRRDSLLADRVACRRGPDDLPGRGGERLRVCELGAGILCFPRWSRSRRGAPLRPTRRSGQHGARHGGKKTGGHDQNSLYLATRPHKRLR